MADLEDLTFFNVHTVEHTDSINTGKYFRRPPTCYFWYELQYYIPNNNYNRYLYYHYDASKIFEVYTKLVFQHCNVWVLVRDDRKGNYAAWYTLMHNAWKLEDRFASFKPAKFTVE